MPKLYSYCIKNDAGAAPNPFWGLCTLVICKPKIRLAAEVGDWVTATGSKHAPTGDASGRMVYAMRITRKLTMEEYDRFAAAEYPNKLPDWRSSDRRRRMGDAIYDFSATPPPVRRSVHSEHDRDHDLGGKYALLSTEFHYFGRRAVAVPAHLSGVVRQTQGHQSHLNDRYVEAATAWIRKLPSGLQGDPQMWDDVDDLDDEDRAPGCARRVRTDVEDEEGEDAAVEGGCG
jgi:hypothetical protein